MRPQGFGPEALGMILEQEVKCRRNIMSILYLYRYACELNLGWTGVSRRPRWSVAGKNSMRQQSDLGKITPPTSVKFLKWIVLFWIILWTVYQDEQKEDLDGTGIEIIKQKLEFSDKEIDVL